MHTYNQHHPNKFRVVQESRSMLEGIPAMKEQIDNTRLIISKSQPPNFKRILTKDAFNDNPFKGEVSKCSNTKCGCCKFLQTGNNFFFHGEGMNFNIKFDMTCSTENVLYVLTCKGCNEYYVGQTSNALRKRNCTNSMSFFQTLVIVLQVDTLLNAPPICPFPCKSMPF